MATTAAGPICSAIEQPTGLAAPLLGRTVSTESSEKAKGVVKSQPEIAVCRVPELRAPAAAAADEHEIELDIDRVREELVVNGEKAVGHLCYAAMEHASDGITNADQKAVDVFNALCGLREEDMSGVVQRGRALGQEVVEWAKANRLKAALLVVGLGGTAFKAKSMAALMQSQAESFVRWGRSAPLPMRFLGFIGLMTVRLFVSTLVPPTSPGFGIILQAATPEAEKWTAMPLFLLASAAAGAVPFLVDKLLECFCGRDFVFTGAAKRMVGHWPLTCWTVPSMERVFRSVGGGKFGASLAVIVAHAAPFMGAQTTLMQRYFLPHPVDVIVSQPFGMSEDLLSMALAEATSTPELASASVALLVCGLNFARFALFTNCGEPKALATGLLNALVGLVFVWALTEGLGRGFALGAVSLQLAVQVFVVPCLAHALCALWTLISPTAAGEDFVRVV